MDMVLVLFLALFIPLFILGIIRKFDFYQTGQYNTILLSLVLGGIAFGPAAIINQIVLNFGLLNPQTIEQFIAPISEETIKGLFLLFLVRRQKFTYSVDGALYGFAVGIGFAVIENISYILTSANIDFWITLQRIFTTNLVHAFSSAAIGIALGIYYLSKSKLKLIIPVTGVLIAIFQHMLYNNIIHMSGIDNHPFITLAPGIPGIFFIGFIMWLGVKQAQLWIKERLGMENRVTRNEVAAINKLTGPKDTLYPVVERFGVEKARMVEKLLNIQARMGIKRKSLDIIQDNQRMRLVVETEISEMQKDMDKLRREIGTYVMLFVRGLFTEEMVSVWGQMQAKIQARSAATGGQKGGGLWKSLDDRIKPPPNDEGSD